MVIVKNFFYHFRDTNGQRRLYDPLETDLNRFKLMFRDIYIIIVSICVCDLELKFIFPRKHIHTEHIPMKHRNLNKNDKYFYLLFFQNTLTSTWTMLYNLRWYLVYREVMKLFGSQCLGTAFTKQRLLFCNYKGNSLQTFLPWMSYWI